MMEAVHQSSTAESGVQMSGSRKIDLNTGQMEAEINKVVDLIRAEKYYAARARLSKLKHPRAKSLLAKLDEIAPVPQATTCPICGHERYVWQRVRVPQATGGLLAISVEVDDMALLARICGQCSNVTFFLTPPPGVEVP